MKIIELTNLNFAENYQIRLKQTDENDFIFCPIRKKWLQLTPEEWVRQHVVQFLIQTKKISKSAINSEVKVEINGMSKRADVLVFNKEKVFLIVECKAPHIPITQAVFDQIARYNMELNSEYLMVTNGLNHYYCQMDHQNQSYQFLPELPERV